MLKYMSVDETIKGILAQENCVGVLIYEGFFYPIEKDGKLHKLIVEIEVSNA